MLAEAFTKSKVVGITGVGPIDSLINAAVLLQTLIKDNGAYPP